LKYFIGKQYATKIAAALFTLMLAGCSALRPTEAESVRTYLLEAQFDRTEQVKSIPLVLTVSPPRAAPGYNTDRMAYIRQPHLLEYFAKNRWAESPAKMLSPLLVRSMELRTGFKSVTSADSMVKGNVRLDSEIILLQQEFTTTPSHLHMKLRIQLVEQASLRVLATQIFDAVEAAPTDDPYGGVIAANRMITRLLGEIADFASMKGASLAEHGK
jgi:cholesterol transport system auxiliary component